MAVSTRDEGVHKHSSPARSMLDGPQQSAPDVSIYYDAKLPRFRSLALFSKMRAK